MSASSFTRKRDSANLPPPVTRLANQVMTTDELFEHCKKESIGNTITTAKL